MSLTAGDVVKAAREPVGVDASEVANVCFPAAAGVVTPVAPPAVEPKVIEIVLPGARVTPLIVMS